LDLKPIQGVKTVCEIKLENGETFVKQIDNDTSLFQIQSEDYKIDLRFGKTILKKQCSIFNGVVTILEGLCIIDAKPTWIND
jgi:hypothetical protein